MPSKRWRERFIFSIPSNDEYPHAPWWTYDPKANEVESTGVTAELVSFILKFADSNTEIYKKGRNFLDRLIEKLKTQNKFGDMGLEGYCVFVDTIKEVDCITQTEYDSLMKRLRELV